MNILQEIDSTLHYENVEKAWKKYKFHFAFILIVLFGGIAGFNAYNAKVIEDSKNDTSVIFDIMIQKATAPSVSEMILASLDEVTTQQGLETLKLELAKAFKDEEKLEEYEKTLLELTTAKTKVVKNISVYMLAEYYLNTKPGKAVELIDNLKISKKDFAYASVQEIKAMALSYVGKTDEAKAIYVNLIANAEVPTEQKTRLEMKLKQLK